MQLGLLVTVAAYELLVVDEDVAHAVAGLVRPCGTPGGRAAGAGRDRQGAGGPVWRNTTAECH